MKKYIRESIDKFKTDALSKLIYDVLKWIVPISITFAASKWIPFLTNLISSEYSISLYWIVLYSLVLIILTIISVNIIFRKKYKELQSDNFTDELTGLKNHKALKQYLTEALEELKGNTKTLSLIIIDVDDFKKLNTKVGFNTADKILKKVGELLASDKRATDETFRQFLRGDEFLVIAKETNLTNAFLAAERKRELIANTGFVVDGKTYNLTVSCGVAEYKRGEDNYTTLTDRVIAALNEAKLQKNKNCTKSNF